MITKKRIISFITILCMVVTMIPAMTMKADAKTSQWESESNNYAGSADYITIKGGASLNGSISSYYDVDFFKFSLDKGSKVVLRTSYYADDYLKVELFKPDNLNYSFYRDNVGYSSNRGYAYSKSTIYLSEGTYYLRLQGGSKASYVLDFDTSGYENFSEPNNTIGQATKMKSGKTYKGLLSDDEEKSGDYFRYKCPGRSKYYLTVKNISAGYEGYRGLHITPYDWDGDYDYSIFDGYVSPSVTVYKGERYTKLVTLPKGNTYFGIIASLESGKYKFSITKKPSKVKGVKLSRKSSSSIRVKWESKDNVTGYKIYRKTNNGSYKMIKTVKGSGKTSYTDRNRKAGKEYSYKVRAYKYVNGYACKGYYSDAKPKTL